MKLRDFIERYLLNRDVSDGYADQLKWLDNALTTATGKPPTIFDLTPTYVNQYLKATREKLSPSTRRSRRRMILILWRAAADEGLIPEPPARNIIQIREPAVIRKCWTVQEIKRLLAAAELQHTYWSNGISKRAYWRSWVLAAWGLWPAWLRPATSGAGGDQQRRTRRAGTAQDR
jgi:site-specific recombinase XerD